MFVRSTNQIINAMEACFHYGIKKKRQLRHEIEKKKTELHF